MTRGTDVTDFKRTYRTARADEFPDTLTLILEKETTGELSLRYGENPNQLGAVYRFDSELAAATNIRLAKTGKAGLSATNYMDVARALDILKFFVKPSVVVMKHLLPSGFATEKDHDADLVQTYRKARDADARSAFGSVVAFNRPVDEAVAHELVSTYVEGVAAPEFTPAALEILSVKEDLRAILYDYLAAIPRFAGAQGSQKYEFKSLPTGRVLVQTPYLSSIRRVQDLVLDPLVRTKEGAAFVVERDPTKRELEDLLTAWYVNLGVRSNGIVIVKDGVTLAVGSGQQERVGAVEQAIVKAYHKAMDRTGIAYDPINGAASRKDLGANPLEGAVVSSDGFFPFRDSIDLLAQHGISAVIQPGGSVRDWEVIQAVNEHHMAMAFTLERCFGHF